ncbi:NAD(P)/FAD-dependent oxidoreductase [Peribacillus simplex]|uniref:NAD(P)/FAD-dependent oxidoreductase n=1 Tax=Peribacillus simplex TaxID=1478 RepID=UPI00367131C0
MITIIGGGPAGIGMGVLLKQNGIDDFIILERDQVGSTFFQWPEETRFITPSFTAHGFSYLDLNAILPDTSPAYTFGKEHLSGEEYGEYLCMIAEHYKLPVSENTQVHIVEKREEKYWVQTSEKGDGFFSESVIIACGEFQFPKRPFKYGIHYGDVTLWKEIEGDRIIIGGGESAADAAYHLNKDGRRVDVYYSAKQWFDIEVDPSRTLSPFTRERLESTKELNGIFEHPMSRAISVEKDDEKDMFLIQLENGDVVETKWEPIICTGFASGAKQFKELFEWNEEGLPILTEKDESTLAPSVYLIGPNVRQSNTIFCFIYKFRQRFAIIAEDIIFHHNLPRNQDIFELYKKSAMYLDDLSCCEKGCAC